MRDRLLFVAAGDQLGTLVAAVVDDRFVQRAEARAGIGAIYSKPSDFRTSTMKSEPGRSAVNTSTARGAVVVSAASAFAEGTGAFPRRASADCCALATGLPATIAAAPTAEPFKKPRRSIEALDLLINISFSHPARLSTLSTGAATTHILEVMLSLALLRVNAPADLRHH